MGREEGYDKDTRCSKNCADASDVRLSVVGHICSISHIDIVTIQTRLTMTTPPPPPPRGYDGNHWKLISQGAEARLWLIDNYLTIVSGTGTTTSSSGGSGTSSSSSSFRAAICKERFAKSYRHPTLDARLTKSRTRAEARCLARCRKAGVRCPAVLGVELAVPACAATTRTARTSTSTRATSTRSSSSSTSCAIANVDNNSAGGSKDAEGVPDAEAEEVVECTGTAITSSCIYLEHIEGCTVREYLERTAAAGGPVSAEKGKEEEAEFAPDRDSDDEKQAAGAGGGGGGGGENGPNKRAKLEHHSGEVGKNTAGAASGRGETKTKMTRVDDDAMRVAKEIGMLIADMHNSNIVHGDLTTSESPAFILYIYIQHRQGFSMPWRIISHPT